MPLPTDTAIQLRLRINDKPRRHANTFYGDGTASAYELGAMPGGIVTGGGASWGPSAFVPLGNTAWSATGATFNYGDGTVAFTSAISANSAFQVAWYDAVFSDAEIDYITANYGDLNSQHLEIVNTLMMDAFKRARWAGGGVSYDDSQTFKNLIQTREMLRSALTVEQGPLGGFESWGEQQQNYPASNRW